MARQQTYQDFLIKDLKILDKKDCKKILVKNLCNKRCGKCCLIDAALKIPTKQGLTVFDEVFDMGVAIDPTCINRGT